MRLVTTVALKRRRNHTPSHADCLLERKPRPAPAGRRVEKPWVANQTVL